VESQFSILYSLVAQRDSLANIQLARAAKEDSNAMKTISILTLAFLPATFVSAVFSTTVFDFQNWNHSTGVASNGWWVYVLCCLLSTAATVTAWFVWMR
ncbi:hypothetical protein K432DRAFT_253065, partial [Lepidopterella palustris CBS 459.81]